ncbi:MAG: hypothetical protein U9N59_12655 [Campylobacterota bacterium]|nr:hypothetical protein [Campylobacterota bacterium]
MQITALTDIVEGKLLNTPAISFITQIHTNISKINEGDAFFTSKQSKIEVAIEKGAFSIIVDFEPNIVDDEIAWIKVDNLNKAISNILRYKLLNNNIKYIHTNKIFFKFLNIFKTKEMSHVVSLTNNLSNDFELLNSCENDKLIFGTNLKFLNAIGTNVLTLKHENYDIKNLTSHSLFETSFSHKDKFFDKLKLPTVYIDDLLQQLELFEYKLDMRKLNNFDLFKPIFINKSNQIVNFGQTNKFILANKDIEICDIEINYLKNHYSYGEIEVLNVEKLNNNEIFQNIKNLKFNALYIVGCDIKKIIDILEQNYTTHTLTI